MRYLDKYAAREKQLRRLEREANRLRHAQIDAPVVPLERVFQRGWVKTYVLADRVDRRLDAPIFRTVLAAVNRSVWARDRSFVHHRTREPVVLSPLVIPFHQMERLGWPASHRRLFAVGTWRISHWELATWHGHFDEIIHCTWTPTTPIISVYGYKLAQTWWLREDLQPYLITHQRVDLPEVKSRLAEIEAFMSRTRGWDRLSRLHGHSNWWRSQIPPRRDLRATHQHSEQLETVAD